MTLLSCSADGRETDVKVSMLITREDGTRSELMWSEFERVLQATLGVSVTLIATKVVAANHVASPPSGGPAEAQAA